jgi:nucleotide-binding universal stress UspA family protein
MFKNVIVGVDGRPGGDDAIALATRLADPDARLTLVHVHAGELDPAHAVTPGLVREEREASLKLLEDARAAAEVSAELASVVSMSAGGGLHAQAEERESDLVVVGACNRGRVGRAMLRDDTRSALNGAPCAVAMAARGYADRPVPLAKVGVAYNESPESSAALALARRLAAPRATVHALEVLTLPNPVYTGIVPPAIGKSLDALLEQANGRLQKLPSVEGRAVYGLVREELAAFSAQVDILVVGSRGYGPLRRLVLGSTADYLERHARCSLLVLPRGAAAKQAKDAEATARRQVESRTAGAA